MHSVATVAVRGWQVPRRFLAVSRSVAVAVALAIVATAAPTFHHQNPFASSGKADPALLRAARAAGESRMPVIVRESDPASSGAEALVRSLGGTVTHELSIVGGFSARIPGSAVPDLVGSGSVLRVWGDGRIHMLDISSTSATSLESSITGPGAYPGGTYDTTTINGSTAANQVWQQVTRVEAAHTAGYDGSGVTVALLDTGITQSPDFGNRVLARVDLTSEQDGLDHFGHGTHMAGIIAGDGSAAGKWLGVAPGARLVSVKVAGANGATDVSVVIAGLQWIVSHKNKYNIKVLNLSFGTDSTQSYLVDPLDYAVEQAWFQGIAVVVAAGNRGPNAGTINKPADDPFVITIGAADLKNTTDRSDDVVAGFSSRGPTQDGLNKPGILAPGVTIVSDRAPGSTIDQAYPSARVGDNYFKGTGTSQAAAVISGVVALMDQANPSMSPDQVKAALKGTLLYMPNLPNGPGLVDAFGAVSWANRNLYLNKPANVGVTPSTGLGSLEDSRGSLHVYADLPGDGLNGDDADGQLDPIQGEIDVLGNPWPAPWFTIGWSATGWAATGWASLAWLATGWAATGWADSNWSGASWTATGWAATGWAATGWAATGWAATGWAATGWAGDAWS